MQGKGERQEQKVGHVPFEMSARQPRRDVKNAVACVSLELKEDVWGCIFGPLQHLKLKTKKINWGMRVQREEKMAYDGALKRSFPQTDEE